MNPNRFYYQIDDSYSFYHSITNNPQGFDTHIHRSYEILHFISGDAAYYIEGQIYKMNPGDVIFTNTRELHKIIFNSNQPYERKFIQFKPAFILGLQVKDCNLLALFENRKLGFNNQIKKSDVHKYDIDTYIELLHKYSKGGTPTDNVMIKTTLIQMLVTMNHVFLDNYQDNSKFIQSNPKVDAILAYINNNLEQNITLPLLEQIFYIDKYYLCRIFKQTTGFSVIEYLTYKRIMKAKEMLVKNIPAVDTAAAVGYNDYSTFYRSFKKIVGLSPKQYQDKHR